MYTPRTRCPPGAKLLDFAGGTRYGREIEARYPSGKGEVCKTFMRRFDPDPRLHNFNNIAKFGFGRLNPL